MLLQNIKIFCINLDRSQDRWERVTQNFNQLGQEVERFPAFDGKLMTENDVPPSWIEFNYYGTGWSGCSLSHYRLWEHILTTDLPYACILEDDAHATQRIDNIEVPDDFDILYISSRIAGDSSGKAMAGCGTESYIVSRVGCEKLLTICEDMYNPIDLRIQAHIRGFIEHGHGLCKGFSDPNQPFHSKKHDELILEGYKTPQIYTRHQDYGVSYVNG